MPLDTSAKGRIRYECLADSTEGRDLGQHITSWAQVVNALVDGVRTKVFDTAERDEAAIGEYVNCIVFLGNAWTGAARLAVEDDLRQSNMYIDASAYADLDWLSGQSVRKSTAWPTRLTENTLDVTAYLPWAIASDASRHVAAGIDSEEIRFAGSAGTEGPDESPATHVEITSNQGHYPLLNQAISEGRITGAGLPSPGSRRLRAVEELPSDTEAQQVGFGRSGEPPDDHLRRRRLPNQ